MVPGQPMARPGHCHMEVCKFQMTENQSLQRMLEASLLRKKIMEIKSHGEESYDALCPILCYVLISVDLAKSRTARVGGDFWIAPNLNFIANHEVH